jgi:hypothetical protein
MKNLMEIEKGSLKISPEALMIKEFKRIWTRDRSQKKEKALKELAYIYHTVDYLSLYRSYHVDTRDVRIKEEVFSDTKWVPDKEVLAGIERYKALQTTLSMQLLNDAEIGLMQLRNYFRNIKFADEQGDAINEDNGVAAKNYIANMKALGDLIKSHKVLKDEVEKELTDVMQLRGRKEIGRRELPPERR